MRTKGSSIDSLKNIANFPLRLIEPLKANFCLFSSRVVNEQTSNDKSTTKLLVELQDGLRVETVIIRHGAITSRKPDGESRTTLCVSSQVGCNMGCKFCATGTMGILGDLCSGEILEQLLFARQFAEIRNIVFMGMGEPMNNYKSVVSAVIAMIDPHRFKLSPNRITVSTVGVPKPMKAFIQDLPQVNLALSLHAPTQELRSTIVPSARGFPIEKLMATADDYLEATGRTLLVEYVLLSGVNDSVTVAHQLGELLAGKKVTVNLIPYNSTDVSAQYVAPPRKDILAFQRVLKEHQIATTIRKEMGPDIAAACGQLVVSKGNESKDVGGNPDMDIEDILRSTDQTKIMPDGGVNNTSRLAKDGRPHANDPLWPMGLKIKHSKPLALDSKTISTSRDGAMGLSFFNFFVLMACILIVPLLKYSDAIWSSWLNGYHLG